MGWSRGSKSRAYGIAGLREERKSLAVRYTIDAAEAQRREEVTAGAVRQELVDVGESGQVAAKDDPTHGRRRGGVSPGRDMTAARRDPEPRRYVIELRTTGLLWHWAVFDLVAGGDDTASPLALRSLDPVTRGTLPRLSERSARRAAERAAREAYGLGNGAAGAGKAFQLQH